MQPKYDCYRAVIRYLGGGFCGFQVQPAARTVQGELCRTLAAALAVPVLVTGCSRTDAGVHANAFVIRIDAAGSTVPPEKLPLAAASFLPPDLAIVSAEACDPAFHPRYDAVAKEYLYRIVNTEIADPFSVGRVWFLRRPIDEDGFARMKIAVAHFLGKHDFSSFVAAGADTEGSVRTVLSASLSRRGAEIAFRVRADGFLYRMVRIMVGTLTEVAFGKIPPDAIPAILAAKDRSLAGPTAPADGLYLDRVFYASPDGSLAENGIVSGNFFT